MKIEKLLRRLNVVRAAIQVAGHSETGIPDLEMDALTEDEDRLLKALCHLASESTAHFEAKRAVLASLSAYASVLPELAVSVAIDASRLAAIHVSEMAEAA